MEDKEHTKTEGQGQAAPGPQPTEIVRLLVKDGVVTEEQVERALKIQSRLDTPRPLLDVLMEIGYATDDAIKKTLIRNRTGIRLGSLLVELGYISEKQLEVALKKQKEGDRRQKLGELLISNKYITEHDLSQVLGIHLGFEFVKIDPYSLDRSLLEKQDMRAFKKQLILPFAKKDNQVFLAMADPLDSTALSTARGIFGPNITPCIVEKRVIEDTFKLLEARETEAAGPPAVDTAQVVVLVDEIFEQAVLKGVSDIHIEPMKNRCRVRFRKDGSLIHYKDITKEVEAPLVNRIKVLAQADITERRRHQEGRILISPEKFGMEIDMRVSFYVSFFGETVVLRILTKKPELLKVTDIGMPPKVMDRFREEVLDIPTGVVIITGPTGSGKTTTLYAAVNYSNHPDTKIITAEEPIEYLIEGVTQCTINPKIGITFEETLRHILRQDPDIIVLGEIRDKMSAESAIQAALTGHKVLTTFHTEDTIGGLLRLMNMDIETFLISSTVVSVLAQRLIKKNCPHCSEPYTPSPRDLRRLKYTAEDIANHRFKLGSGCEHCEYTGYSGRIGVFELLVLNEYVKEAILARKPSSEIRKICLETTGLITLLEDGIAKASKGVTSIREVIKTLPVLEPPRPISQILRLSGVPNE